MFIGCLMVLDVERTMIESKIFPGLPILLEAQVALASASPRRRELLARLLPLTSFKVISADVDESRLPGEAPADYVHRLALSKAEQGANLWLATQPTPGPKLIIAADTTVALDDNIYGKPANAAEAAQMLRELSAKGHLVLTGFAVRLLDARHELVRQEAVVCQTEVEMRPLTQAEIDWYVETGEPMDKAGAYAVQGYGSTFVEAIRGDYYNVVGLPIVPLIELLRTFMLAG